MLVLIDSEGAEYQVMFTENTIDLNAVNALGIAWLDKGLAETKNKLFDNGNGVEIALGKRKIKLNYSEQEHLYLLLKLWKYKFEVGPKQEYKLVEVAEIEELK